MKTKKVIIVVSTLTILALGIIGCSSSDANTNYGTDQTDSDIPSPVDSVDEKPGDDLGQLIGGTPGSCGYQWDAQRTGWYRPWDSGSFIPAADKPEWDEYIPVSASDPVPAPRQDQDSAEVLDIQPAPIHDVEIVLAESYPPQVIVHVRGGLSSGCTAVHEIDTTRDGETIKINITTARPRDLICTTVYELFDETINLGTDFESGQTYVIMVNDNSITFTME